MTKHTATMSGAWVLSWNGQAPDMMSVCFVMKWSSPKHSISLFCHDMVKPQTYYQSVFSWNGQVPDIVSVCFVMKHCYYIWSLTISWQNTLILCLGLDHFMTKHTATMSGAWPFHDKTHCYYVCGLTISWHNTLLLWITGIDVSLILVISDLVYRLFY
jgi:hypothetical protein